MEIETTLAGPRVSANSEMSDTGGEDPPSLRLAGPVVRIRLWPARKRHPIPVRAFFQHSLVLTYAVPAHVLAPLLPPGLVLDTFRGLGFIAIAMVQTKNLRPAPLPAFLGQDFFLSGYRIFARLPNQRWTLLSRFAHFA